MGIKSKATGNAKVGRMVITGGKNRVLVARKPRAKEWTLERQATFLEELAMTGNVTTSVVVVGMSLGGAYHRRSHDPAFAAAWQAALSRGYDRLEELLLATSLASLVAMMGVLAGRATTTRAMGVWRRPATRRWRSATLVPSGTLAPSKTRVPSKKGAAKRSWAGLRCLAPG